MVENFVKVNIKLEDINIAQKVIGMNDKYLKLLEHYFNLEISTRGEDILVKANGNEDKITELEAVLEGLIVLVNNNISFNERDILYLLTSYENNTFEKAMELYVNKMVILRKNNGATIYAKTINQKKYIDFINNNDLVFGIGPAGTGKTYLAVANAVYKLKNNGIKKIILTRPAVEAGERLGFLPGDLKEKVDPYLVPLYDALYDFLGKEQADKLIETNVIEIAPLAYMRGRTLDNAYVILDEAQNTTEQQMKMFLTRLGFNSKMVVTGDITQVDLPRGMKSGVITATKILKQVRGIQVAYFDKSDVIRHPLVQKVIEKYEEYEDGTNRKY